MVVDDGDSEVSDRPAVGEDLWDIDRLKIKGVRQGNFFEVYLFASIFIRFLMKISV